jgi:3-phenylpropionate/cinnamic acid dioxygenase small subunit
MSAPLNSAESQAIALADVLLHHEVSQFLYREARLVDEHRFDEWESLWTDDAVYWVPANGEGGDPEQQMSIIYDNRSRIHLRIQQFHTGKRYSQNPQSRLRRVLSNIEILAQDESGVRVGANMLLFEASRRGDIVWGSRNEYVLRKTDAGWRMARKEVKLVNNEKALLTTAFLI